jgi:hypothetical protein
MTFNAKEFGAETGRLVKEAIQRAVLPLKDRIARLEKDKSALAYVGVWRDDADYQRGNFATTNGSLFHCETSGTKSRPGTDSTWKLCVKQGTFS